MRCASSSRNFDGYSWMLVEFAWAAWCVHIYYLCMVGSAAHDVILHTYIHYVFDKHIDNTHLTLHPLHT